MIVFPFSFSGKIDILVKTLVVFSKEIYVICHAWPHTFFFFFANIFLNSVDHIILEGKLSETMVTN